MINWTELTKNPIDEIIGVKILNELKSKRKINCNQLYRDYLKQEIKNKNVLDIGVAEHDVIHINRKDWQHKFIVDNSKYCVGVDIIDELVQLLSSQGYNIKNVDATSDLYIGETFDVVIIGDVIEHVENPVALMKFAKRHCSIGGKIIVATPNPFFYKNFLQVINTTTFVANFEHISWITPSMALEIARRSGLEFYEYLFFIKCKRPFRKILNTKFPEILNDRLYYVFKNLG